MKHEKIKELSQAETETATLRDNPDELLYAVLSAALYSEDSAWAEDVCIQLARHEHYNVRGQAEDAKDDIKFYLRWRFKRRKKQSESNGLSSKSMDAGAGSDAHKINGA
jgi:hypothetical protein